MNYGKGNSWESQSTPEVKVQAARAFANPPPAIVQPAEMTPAQFKTEAQICARLCGEYTERLQKIYDSFLSRWKEFGKTRDLAAEEVFGTSWHAIKERVRRLSNTVADEVSSVSCVSEPEQEKAKTLKKVSELPDPKEDPPEKPAVHAATPEQMKRAKAPEPEPTTKPPMDVTGAIIPQHLLALRERRQEVTTLEHHAATLRAFLERLQADKDVLWANLKTSGSVQHFMATLATLRYQIAECTPDVVCPQCQGNGKAHDCVLCYGSGWIAKVRWDREYAKSNDKTKLAVVQERAKNL